MYNQPFSEGLHIKFKKLTVDQFKKLTVDQFLNSSLILAGGESLSPPACFLLGRNNKTVRRAV